MESILDGWMGVSVEGFREQNLGRPPAHLLKELVQNGMDAVGSKKGSVELDLVFNSGGLLVSCRDTGEGMNNLANISTMFYTGKHDQPLMRGRMGRGFKEILSVSEWCEVVSREKSLRFYVENGEYKRKLTVADPSKSKNVVGVSIRLFVRGWDSKFLPSLTDYFTSIIPPDNITFKVNGEPVKHRKIAHTVEAKLNTELFVDGRWSRRGRETTVNLIRVGRGEDPFLYEMGIPVCPVEWDRPYHVDVQQRVPMNPNRDAVATGYLTSIHRSCLPALLDEMDEDEIKQDWVGQALPDMPEEVQRAVIARGFGTNLARAVPPVNSTRDFNADAREAGVEVVDTRVLSGGFRKVISEFVPSAAEVVRKKEDEDRTAARMGSLSLDDVLQEKAKSHLKWVAKWGEDRVRKVIGFVHWLVDCMLEPEGAACRGVLIDVAPRDIAATWSSDDVLTLHLDTACFWQDPMGEKAMSIYVHEVAHHRAMHHGDNFHEEVERMAGRAASILLREAEHIHAEWPELFTRLQ